MKKTKFRHTEEQLGRIVAFLTREEIDFMDRISKDALFSTGHKLTRTDIIRALIDAIKMKEISGKGLHSKGDLERRLLNIMNMTLPQALYDLKNRESEREDD